MTNHSEPYRRDWRFERCMRLFGKSAMQILRDSHVAVFGLGGVGSYAVEALARTGIGQLTLVDFDRVCMTNVNRQIHAFPDTVGEYKADLMAERVQGINPNIRIRACREFYNRDTSEELLAPRPDLVIDCIDNVTAKMHLVATCIDREIPLVTSLGSAAKKDPTRVQVVPLSKTHSDPLGKALRKYIRKHHQVTNGQLGTVTAVFSDEPVIMPSTEHGEIVCGVNCVCPGGDDKPHSCSSRNIIHGTAVFVTGVFGMTAAAAAVERLLEAVYSPMPVRKS